MKKILLRLFDRLVKVVSCMPGGNRLLAYATTCYARSVTKRDIRLLYTGRLWLRVEAGVSIVLGSEIKVRKGNIARWQPEGTDVFDIRKDWWYRYYRPSKGDTIVDIGAGMGEDAHVFSRSVGIDGCVVAIEAHPETFNAFNAFNEFLTYNHISNVRAICAAASEKRGDLFMTSLAEQDWQCNSVADLKTPHNPIRVEAMPLDEIKEIRAVEVIHFLKMNIEGAEVSALRGANKTLEKTEALCICCHDFLGQECATKKSVCEILLTHGFALYFPNVDSPPYERYFVYGVKTPRNANATMLDAPL